MAIAYSASKIVYSEFDNSTQQATQDGIRDALVAAAWTVANASGGYTLRSKRTPQGLQCSVRIQNNSTLVGIQFNTILGALTFNQHLLDTAPGRRLKIIANRYQFFIFLPLGPDVKGTSVMGGVPYIHPHHAPIAITGFTAGAPCLVDTAVPHGLVDSQSVFISDMEGTNLTGINSSWTIQVVNSTRLRLMSSNFGTGVWTPNTGYLAGPGKISRLIWSMGDLSGSVYRVTFRSSAYPTSGAQMNQSVATNQLTWNQDGGSGAGRIGILTPPYGVRWYNNQFINCEPYLIYGPATSGSEATVNGQIWDAAAVNYGFTGDLTTVFDGHTWLNYTGSVVGVNQNGALFLALG